MPWRFEECRQRIGRAKVHREAIAKVWSEIADKEDFYGVHVTMKDDGAGVIWMDTKPLPPIIGLQLGEMLYQLRATLDGCVYRAAAIDSGSDPPPNENNLEFPICWTRPDFKNSSSKIRPLKKKRRDIIKSVQPYDIPNLAPDKMVFNFNRTLGILHDWARWDRHRRLHVVGSWASGANPKLVCPPSTTLSYLRVNGSGFVENKDEIATFKLAGYSRGMTVQANPDLFIDIAVDEVPPPCADNDTLGNRLRAMLVATYTIVRAFEDIF